MKANEAIIKQKLAQKVQIRLKELSNRKMNVRIGKNCSNCIGCVGVT